MYLRKSFFVLLCLLVLASCKTTSTNGNDEFVSKYLSTQELEINSVDTIKLSGTLEYSSTRKLVIFIAGSGPTDRDCNSGLGLESHAFRMLASELKSANISSFRYDKRGVAKSTKVPEESMTIHDRVIDVSAVVDYFATDFEDIVLLGHSEGVLVGSIVAASHSKVASFVAVSGISIPMDKILLEQFEKYPRILPEVQQHISELKADDDFSEVHMVLKSIFRPSVRPFLKSAFDLDPMVEISRILKPVFIVSGECDLQVPLYHATALHKSCENSELKIIKKMGHVLKLLEPDCSNARLAYGDPDLALNKDFVSEILKFIN